MTITLPPELEGKITEEQVLLEIVIALRRDEVLTTGEAAALLGTDRPHIWDEMGKRRVSMVTEQSVREDIATTDRLAAERRERCAKSLEL